jgi:hypothetical protein
LHKAIVFEDRISKIEQMVLRITDNEKFIDTMEKRVDEVIKKIESSGGSLLQDAVKGISEIEERQLKAIAAIDSLSSA